MNCTKLFARLFLVGTVVIAIGVSSAAAQCCGGGAAVAYAPTYAPAYTTAYAPSAVYQTYRPTTGWYPGALLDRWRMNRWSRWNDSTVVTAAYAPTYTTSYAPTYATAYTAAYTPTYPPSYYATSYRAAYPMGYTVGYAPTVASAPCCSREVVMRPVCDTCVSPCAGCCGDSYVGQAVYESAGSTGCVGCAPTATSTYVVPGGTSPTPANGATPQPGIDPGAQIPEERRALRAKEPGETSVIEEDGEEPTPTEEEETDVNPPSTLFEAPQIFDPGDRVTQRPNAPVWTAVYHTTAKPVRQVAKPVSAPSKPKPTAEEVAEAAKGWTSAGR